MQRCGWKRSQRKFARSPATARKITNFGQKKNKKDSSGRSIKKKTNEKKKIYKHELI